MDFIKKILFFFGFLASLIYVMVCYVPSSYIIILCNGGKFKVLCFTGHKAGWTYLSLLHLVYGVP